MKRSILFITSLTLIFICCKDTPQTDDFLDLPDMLNIESQDDIAMYCDALAASTTYQGSLVFGAFISSPDANPIIDLSCFSHLEVITGSLTISGASVAVLNQFSSLKTIGGDLGIFDGSITDIDFPTLESVNNLYISGCTSLSSIAFPSCLSIANNLQITNNTNLSAISGFNDLTTISNIDIGYNASDYAINGFENLQRIDNNWLLENEVIRLGQGTFTSIESIHRMTCRVLADNGLDFSWASNVDTSESITIQGQVELADLCPFQTLIEDDHTAIAYIDSFGNIFYGNSIRQECGF